MPAYQSVAEFDLSRKYHLKAVVCEQCAAHASDPTAETGMAGARYAMALHGGSSRQDVRSSLAGSV
jgi:hypothetical protein